MKKIVLLFLFGLMINVVWGQQTVGVFINTANSEDGYVLFAPQYSTVTYLIDKCGRVVHTWTSKFVANRTVNILPDGSLLRPRAGAVIERLDWNSNILWSYTLKDDTEYQSHEVYPMPNGNVLALVWENKTAAEAISAGFNPALLQGATIVVATKIEEIKPIGIDSGAIVWLWDSWDHLIQDYDSTKPNYGVVADHPELINLNYVTTKPDYGNAIELLHSNSVDYNPALNQVMVSHRYFSEFWILDHSTTTAQAATHTGGAHNKGGDLIYRWGNAAAYNQGTIANEEEFGQHNVQWVDSGYPGAGHITAFNDGYRRPGTKYSEADEIIPPIDSNGNYSFMKPYTYGPPSLYWFASTPGYYSYIIGGVQRLINGNTLVCAGQLGTFYEVDSNKNLVWEYVNPVTKDTNILSQGDPVDSNFVFRCTLYQASYPGLAGKDLTPGKPIEHNALNTGCQATCPPKISPPSPSICSKSGVTLTASESNSYSWSPGTGLNDTAATTVIASPTVTTTYYVTGVTGTCSGTGTVVVTVNPTLVLTITPIVPSICYGSSIALTASGASTYSWSPANSLSDTAGTTVIANPTITSTYVITGTTNACGVSDTVTITVNPIPTLTITPTAPSICYGSSISLTASGASTYSWSPAVNLNNTTGTVVIANPTATSTYTITGTTDACRGTDSIIVTVIPIPTLTITPISTAICNGSAIALTVSGAAFYSWSPASSLSDTAGTTVIANPTATSTYTITGTTGTCSGTDSVIITVNPLPTLTISQTSPYICYGSSTTLSVSGATTYSWSPAVGLSDTIGSVVIADPTITTTYIVSGVTDTCSGRGTVIVNVDSLPAIPTITLNGDTLKSSNSANYQWFLESKPITGATDQSYIALTNGWYYVMITDSNGCSSLSDSIDGSPATSIYQTTLKSAVTLFPNPFNNVISLRISSDVKNLKSWNLQVTDELGTMVYSNSSLNYDNTIDLSKLAPGIYIGIINNPSGNAVYKMIKQ